MRTDITRPGHMVPGWKASEPTVEDFDANPWLARELQAQAVLAVVECFAWLLMLAAAGCWAGYLITA